MAPESDSYDEVPYVGRIHFQSHVNTLATVARLFGMSSADPQQSRVLEIGCADGSNLITMAFHLPQSTFVGIDGSAPQIARGQSIIDDLSLENVTLLATDLRDIGAEIGAFDYIIAHGIFSWIAEDARHALMRLCREHLKPQGIAYISYNTYPGWHHYEQLRGMMRFHSRGMSSVAEEIQQARAIVQFVGNAIVDTGSPRAAFFKSVMPQIRQMSDDYVYHEYLELNNAPMYFYEFIGIAQQHGLQYLGESLFHSMMSSNYPEKVAATLEEISNNILELEQYMDFLRNRRFRCTLLCHREVKLQRAVELPPVAKMKVAFWFDPEDPDHDATKPGTLRFFKPDDHETEAIVSMPLHKAALLHLAKQWPAAIPFSELLSHCCSVLDVTPTNELATELAELIMKLYLQSFTELHVFQPPMVNHVAERPRATRLARYQAHNCRVLSSQKHHMVPLSDPQTREVVARLDGTRTIADIVQELLPLVDENTMAQLENPEQAMTANVKLILAKMAAEGVLVPEGVD